MKLDKGFIREKKQEWYYEWYQIDPLSPTMILLHEGLGSVAQWKKWPKSLHEKLRLNILVYDRNGYGKSSAAPIDYPLDYLRYEAQEIFPKILDHLNLESAHLFGHSDGGSIALLAASYHPDRVKSVISEAAHVIIEEVSVAGIQESRKIYDKKLKKPLSRYHADKTDWVFYHWADTWIKPEFFKWNMIEELQHIQCPVLAIQGKDDQYGSYEQLRVIEQYCKSKLLFLNNCGHHPHFEQEDVVLSESFKFISNL